MATITATTSGGTRNWNDTASWTGGVVPTAADDVQLTSTSGAVTINVAASCRSLDCTGYTSTLTHTAALTLSIGDATAGLGNIALKLVSGMTYTLGNTATSAITFVSTAGTTQTITTGGKSLGNWTVNGAGSSYSLADANSAAGSTATTVTLTAGTLSTNNQTCTWGQFASSNSNTRSLSLGSSSISVSGAASAWICATNTNMTFNAGTSTITFTNANATINGGRNFSYNNLVFTGTGGASVITSSAGWGAGVIANLTFTPSGESYAEFNTAATITGTLTLTGASSTQRLYMITNIYGARVGITVNGSVVASNLDIADIQGSGTASWNLSGIIGGCGNCGNNVGITFTTPATQYWIGNGGNWSDSSHWSLSSGGANNGRVPLPQDPVIFDANSIITSSQTLTMDMARAGASWDFSAVTTDFRWTNNNVNNITVCGSVTMSSHMTRVSGTGTNMLGGRSSHTVTMAGNTFQGCTIACGTGTYTLQDAFSAGGNPLTIYGGTLNTNGQTAYANVLTMTNISAQKTLTLGATTMTLVGSGTVVNLVSTLTTINPGTSTIVLTNATSTVKTFAGAGLTFNNLTYTGATIPSQLVITGANTFNTLSVGAGRALTLPSSTATTVTNFVGGGTDNGYLYMPGVSGNYVSSPNSAALQITGDIDLIAYINPTTWLLSGFYRTIIGKDTTGVGGRSYQLGMDSSTRRPAIYWSPNGGTTAYIQVSTANVPFADGTGGWIRATLQVDNGAAGNDVNFYTSSDAPTTDPNTVSWTQLGSTVTSAGTTSIGVTSAQLTLGVIGTAAVQLFTGLLYRAVIKNGINGTTVFDADFTSKPFAANIFGESSSSGALVTLNGTQLQAGDGRVLLNSPTPGAAATLSQASGTVNCDYITVQDSTVTGGATFKAGNHGVNVSNNTGWIFGLQNFGKFLGFMQW